MRQFLVVGIGRFGSSIAESLSKKGLEVLAIDKDNKKVQNFEGITTQVATLDATDEKALKEIGAQDFDCAIVSVGENIEASILITVILKELGVKEVVTEAIDELHAKILRKIGCDRVVFPERDMGIRVAESLITPKIFDFIELSSTHSMMEIVAPKSFEGKTLKEIKLRSKYGVSCIAIKRKIPIVKKDGDTEFSEETKIAPVARDDIQSGDRLYLLGEYTSLEKIKKL